MTKIILSPLFLVLLAMLVTLWLTSGRPGPGRRRLVRVIVGGAWVLLWVLSTPGVAALVARPLEAGYDPSVQPLPDGRGVDTVVVLSGSFSHGPVPELDFLSETSYARVARGVEVFRATGARWFVVTGRSPAWEPPARMAELMAGLAASMGIPEDAILVEPRASNTMAHPIEVARLPQVTPSDTVAVVTSAWHLERARREFARHFARVVPYPADFVSTDATPGVRRWLPDVRALRDATAAIHEYLGLLEYAALHLIGQ